MNKKIKYFIFILFFIEISTKNSAQFFYSVGITSNIGTTVDRIGFFVLPQIHNDLFQYNMRVQATYNLKSYGTKCKGPEFQLGLGFVFPFGKSDNYSLVPLDLLSNQTGKRYAVGYSYNVYIDKAGTSQTTGIIGLLSPNIRLITENDIFSHQHRDRYRTAAALVSLIKDNYIFSIKTVFWTGDSFDPKAIKICNDSMYHSRFGYKDLSNAKWGKSSLGILCFQFEQQFSAYTPQTYKIMVGIDAEQIRHAFQNRFIHDLYFVPEFLIGYHNVHYPMLQQDGSPYLFRKNQKPRKPKLFFNLGLNDNLFY